MILAIATALAAIAVCFFSNRKIVAAGIAIGALLVGVLSVEPYQELRYLSPFAKKQFEIDKMDGKTNPKKNIVAPEEHAMIANSNRQYCPIEAIV